MGSGVSPVTKELVSEEVRRMVADAIESGTTIFASEAAALVARTYPNSGLSEREIADRIAMAAALAGVAVQIGRNDGMRSAEIRTSGQP